MLSLAGKRGLVSGIANQHSIAYGCARVLAEQGAELAVTFLNEKSKPYVLPLADELHASIVMPCDVSKEDELEKVFAAMQSQWGSIDFVIHSLAFCPPDELHGRVVDSHWQAFAEAMNVSCHSFIRMAKLAEPLMPQGGSLLAISYLGAERVVPSYSVMGPVKAALEASARYMAIELAAQNIRCNILSPGPIQTRAAGGVRDFSHILQDARARSPNHTLADIDDVGRAAAFLLSDASRAINASTLFVDEGVHILA